MKCNAIIFMVRILSSISNQQPSSNMDDSGFFSIQVSMKRSFIGLMGVVVGGGLIFISFSSGRCRGGAWGAQAPPLFFGQTEAQRAEKSFSETNPPYLKVWSQHCSVVW